MLLLEKEILLHIRSCYVTELTEGFSAEEPLSNLDTIRSKLTMLDNLEIQGKGDSTIHPPDFGITIEDSKEVLPAFTNRVIAETDVAELVDGLVPPEVLFNPDLPTHLNTTHGQVEVKTVSEKRRLIDHFRSKLSGRMKADASYSPDTKTIRATPAIDAFSTVVAIARESYHDVVGPKVAHEALHALSRY